MIQIDSPRREAYTKALASHRPKVYPLGSPLGQVPKFPSPQVFDL
jgi:hypothetical protein